MPDRIDLELMCAMLAAVVARLRDAKDELAALDAATGDGDHGAAMCKVADAIERCIAMNESDRLRGLLGKIGWAVMGVDAGSTGPLYGSLFLGMSDGCADGDEPEAPELASMLEHGITRLRGNTRAEPGDKTMIDALVPAMAALRTGEDRGQPLVEALEAAACAADEGAKRTADMKAVFGRAKNIGERSIGHVDPGAASMAIVFAGLKEGLANG